MSFDIDPQDKHQRFLLVHHESDCLFECFSLAERDRYCDEHCCDDVTDVKEWEEQFRQSTINIKLKMSEIL